MCSLSIYLVKLLALIVIRCVCLRAKTKTKDDVDSAPPPTDLLAWTVSLKTSRPRLLDFSGAWTSLPPATELRCVCSVRAKYKRRQACSQLIIEDRTTERYLHWDPESEKLCWWICCRILLRFKASKGQEEGNPQLTTVLAEPYTQKLLQLWCLQT